MKSLCICVLVLFAGMLVGSLILNKATDPAIIPPETDIVEEATPLKKKEK